MLAITGIQLISQNPNDTSHWNSGWTLGPESTTEDVVHRYSSLLTRPEKRKRIP